MTAAPRFICSDPDAGDLEFADVEALLDALEAALIASTTVFDTARQSWQAAGLHPEIRTAWAERLRFRPPVPGLGLPALPSVTALVRSLPEDAPGDEARRRDAFARVRAGTPPARVTPTPARDRRFAALALAVALGLLLIVGWAVLSFATRLSSVAAAAVGVRSPR